MRPFLGQKVTKTICTNHMLKFLNQTNIIWDSNSIVIKIIFRNISFQKEQFRMVLETQRTPLMYIT